MSFRTGRRKDDSTYKFLIDKGNDYVPRDLGYISEFKSRVDKRIEELDLE